MANLTQTPGGPSHQETLHAQGLEVKPGDLWAYGDTVVRVVAVRAIGVRVEFLPTAPNADGLVLGAEPSILQFIIEYHPVVVSGRCLVYRHGECLQGGL